MTPATPETVTAQVSLRVAGESIDLQLTMPTAPVGARIMLPLVHRLSDAIVHAWETKVEREGKRVSCAKGCGACCRQLVPISETDARHLRELVESTPEPRRSELKSRFAAARSRLEEAEMLGRLVAAYQNDTPQPGENRDLGMAYFRLGIACPFLEDESCSIHADRPATCREHLVTSPPEYCRDPSTGQVEGVPIRDHVWIALARLDPLPPGRKHVRWVPLVLALDWAEANAEDPPPRTGPEFMQQLFQNLTGKPVSAPDFGEVSKEGEPGA